MADNKNDGLRTVLDKTLGRVMEYVSEKSEQVKLPEVQTEVGLSSGTIAALFVIVGALVYSFSPRKNRR